MLPAERGRKGRKAGGHKRHQRCLHGWRSPGGRIYRRTAKLGLGPSLFEPSGWPAQAQLARSMQGLKEEGGKGTRGAILPCSLPANRCASYASLRAATCGACPLSPKPAGHSGALPQYSRWCSWRSMRSSEQKRSSWPGLSPRRSTLAAWGCTLSSITRYTVEKAPRPAQHAWGQPVGAEC